MDPRRGLAGPARIVVTSFLRLLTSSSIMRPFSRHSSWPISTDPSSTLKSRSTWYEAAGAAPLRDHPDVTRWQARPLRRGPAPNPPKRWWSTSPLLRPRRSMLLSGKEGPCSAYSRRGGGKHSKHAKERPPPPRARTRRARPQNPSLSTATTTAGPVVEGSPSSSSAALAALAARAASARRASSPLSALKLGYELAELHQQRSLCQRSQNEMDE